MIKIKKINDEAMKAKVEGSGEELLLEWAAITKLVFKQVADDADAKVVKKVMKSIFKSATKTEEREEGCPLDAQMGHPMDTLADLTIRSFEKS